MANNKQFPDRFSQNDRSKKGAWVGPWMPNWRDAGENGPFGQLKAIFEGLGTHSKIISERRKELEATKRYSENGVREILKQLATEEIIPGIRSAAAQKVRKIRKEVDDRRAAMKPYSHDPQDLVGELRRQEVRAWLRTMTPEERTKAVRNASDPFIVEAAISVPVELTGLLPSTHVDLAKELVEQRYGPEVEALNEFEKALQTVERAVDGARDDVREELGMAPHDFDAEFKPIEEKIDREAEKVTTRVIVDIDSIAETIKTMNFNDRNKLLDLALEKQVESVKAA